MHLQYISHAISYLVNLLYVVQVNRDYNDDDDDEDDDDISDEVMMMMMKMMMI